jgi:hypothetical protein
MTVEYSSKKVVRGFLGSITSRKKPEEMGISLRENWALNLDITERLSPPLRSSSYTLVLAKRWQASGALRGT